MLQCNVFPGLPPDFLDAEVNLFLVPFMDSEAENENPPRAGRVTSGDIWAMGRQPALGLGEFWGLSQGLVFQHWNGLGRAGLRQNSTTLPFQGLAPAPSFPCCLGTEVTPASSPWLASSAAR